MKVLLITPYYPPSVRGNAITTARLVRGLQAKGVEVEVCSLETQSPAEAAKVARAFRPDLVHGFHCYRSAATVNEVLSVRSCPLVLTATGTDINHDLRDPDRRDTVLAMLKRARNIVAFHDSIQQRIAAEESSLADKVAIIPQSVALEPSKRNFRFEYRVKENEVVFTLPAGIRSVKNVIFPVKPMEALRKEGFPVRLWFAGPVIDKEYAHKFFNAIMFKDWLRYLETIAHEDMEALYRASDVVLNTSISEGGMCNAVLEGMSAGKPILASNIEGNRSVVRDGENGFLYSNEGEFHDRARRLATDSDLRVRLGKAGREQIERAFSPQKEIEEHLRIYEQALSR